jgi:hypothetical protein
MSREMGPGRNIPVGEAALIMDIPEEEARSLSEGGGVPVEKVRERTADPAVRLALELGRAREETGRLQGRLEEVRATNLRLQKDLREGSGERRRLTEEVLELRAAAEERLMLMERVERIAHIEGELVEARAELERLRGRGLLARLSNRA